MTNSSQYLTDLNQFYNGQYYYRDEAVAAPHNLFSNSELLGYALRDLQISSITDRSTSWPTKAEPSANALPATQAPITIAYSNSDYLVAWYYDPTINAYTRWNGGSEQHDVNTNEPLIAQAIIVQRVNTTVLEAATGRLALETQGDGTALLFQDGQVQVGTWKKPARGQPTKFLDESGAEWHYNKGTIWVEVITPTTPLTY